MISSTQTTFAAIIICSLLSFNPCAADDVEYVFGVGLGLQYAGDAGLWASTPITEWLTVTASMGYAGEGFFGRHAGLQMITPRNGESLVLRSSLLYGSSGARYTGNEIDGLYDGIITTIGIGVRIDSHQWFMFDVLKKRGDPPAGTHEEYRTHLSLGFVFGDL